MSAIMLHHVQVSCPVSGEDAARRFYAGALGLPEVPKPASLASRGGCWFRRGATEVHVGIESDFVAAGKAHPAFLVEDIRIVAEEVARWGFPVTWDEEFPGYERFYTVDGNGNRVEVLARRTGDGEEPTVA